MAQHEYVGDAFVDLAPLIIVPQGLLDLAEMLLH
jgi:hypothetical protein